MQNAVATDKMKKKYLLILKNLRFSVNKTSFIVVLVCKTGLSRTCIFSSKFHFYFLIFEKNRFFQSSCPLTAFFKESFLSRRFTNISLFSGFIYSYHIVVWAYKKLEWVSTRNIRFQANMHILDWEKRYIIIIYRHISFI